jgi:hypothetical protein
LKGGEMLLNEWLQEHIDRYLNLVKERLSLDKEVNFYLWFFEFSDLLVIEYTILDSFNLYKISY